MAALPKVGARAGEDLEAFFSPRSVAIVGASDDPTKIGARPLAYLRQLGFPGPVYPVNPRRDMVQGERCYRSVGEIPERFDHAVLAVPVPEVEAVLDACAAGGAVGATIFTSGYAEIGEGGRVAQRRLRAQAARLGIRLLGPNCQGFANVADRAYLTFSSGLERAGAERGPVAVISQSGVLSAVIYVLLRQAGAGISHWVNTGNEADIDAAAALKYVAGRDEVSAVALALETVRSGDAFAAAVAQARAVGKQVFVLKSGRTAEGATTSVSHTGALLARDDFYDALFRQAGAVRVTTLRELVDCVTLAVRWRGAPPRSGRRLAIISNSGGANAVIADAAIAAGLRVPATSEGLRRRLAEMLPEYAVAQNPLDLTGYYISHPEVLDALAGVVLSSGEFDALLIYMGIIGHLYRTDRIVQSFESLRDSSIPVVVVWQAGEETIARKIAKVGLPLFDDIDRAVAALGRLASAAGFVREDAAARTWTVPQEVVDIVRAARVRGQSHLTASQSREVITRSGIPSVPGILCHSPEEASRAAQSFGRVVAKIESQAILHKTDVGGVRTGIETAEGAARAFEEIVSTLRPRASGVPVEGVRIEPQVEGVEVILGMIADRVLGTFVSVGLGGTLVEALSEVATRRLPLRPGEAGEMLQAFRGSVLLEGYRGAPPADRAALAGVLERWALLSHALSAYVAEGELNPVIVGPQGHGVTAVDVLFRLRPLAEDLSIGEGDRE